MHGLTVNQLAQKLQGSHAPPHSSGQLLQHACSACPCLYLRPANASCALPPPLSQSPSHLVARLGCHPASSSKAAPPCAFSGHH